MFSLSLADDYFLAAIINTSSPPAINRIGSIELLVNEARGFALAEEEGGV